MSVFISEQGIEMTSCHTTGEKIVGRRLKAKVVLKLFLVAERALPFVLRDLSSFSREGNEITW